MKISGSLFPFLRPGYNWFVRESKSIGLIVCTTTVSFLMMASDVYAENSLPAATSNVSYGIDLVPYQVAYPGSSFGDTLSGSSSLLAAYIDGGVGDAEASVAANPAGGVTVLASSFSAFQIQAQATLSYYIEILGPSSTDVTVDITGGVTRTVDSGENFALSTLYIGDYQLSAGQCTNFSCFEGVGLTETILNNYPLSLPTNTLIPIFLQAIVSAYGGSQASASADPVFVIDPTSFNGGVYSLLVSPGIGNSIVAAVPEPSSWALMLGGLAIIGSAIRARRKPKLAEL